VGSFLRTTAGIDKHVLGDFLGGEEDFSRRVLLAYVETIAGPTPPRTLDPVGSVPDRPGSQKSAAVGQTAAALFLWQWWIFFVVRDTFFYGWGWPFGRVCENVGMEVRDWILSRGVGEWPLPTSRACRWTTRCGSSSGSSPSRGSPGPPWGAGSRVDRTADRMAVGGGVDLEAWYSPALCSRVPLCG